MNKGWECPKCGSVYAPTVQKCWICPAKPAYGSGTWQPTPWWQRYGTGTVSTTVDGYTYTVNIVNNTKPEDPDDFVGAKI